MRSAAGAVVALAGSGLVGVGLWARRDVRRALARERIVLPTGENASPALVRGPRRARVLAETIREQTLRATEGRTYAETDQFLASEGGTTSDSGLALRDERSGQPIANPDYVLWIQSTTLQSALMQAYLAFRLADLSLGVGAALVAAGVGIGIRR